MDDYTVHMMNARAEALNATDTQIRNLEAGRGDAREIRRLKAKFARDKAKLDALINLHRIQGTAPPGMLGMDFDIDEDILREVREKGWAYRTQEDPETGMYKIWENYQDNSTVEEQRREAEKQENNRYGFNTRCKCGGTIIMEKPVHECTTEGEEPFEMVTHFSIKQMGVCDSCSTTRRVIMKDIRLKEKVPLGYIMSGYEDVIDILVRHAV